MKKLSLLIALAMLITIGGVYATWVYVQTDDVADETMNKAVSMSGVTFEGSNGTFAVDVSGLSIMVDPKPGTTHDTGLSVTGSAVFTFTPATYAPEAVKENAVKATYSIALSNSSWQYENQNIFTVNSYDDEIDWTLDEETGVFSFVLNADQITQILSISQFTLDTKAEYDAFDKALENGLIVFGISDGKTTGSN